MTSGMTTASPSIARRTQSSSMKSGTGTNASANVPMSGIRIPNTVTTHSNEPRATSSKTVCFEPESLPNSRSVAQPRTALSNRPANRPNMAKTEPMIAIGR
jgi:hypothetical protein